MSPMRAISFSLIALSTIAQPARAGLSPPLLQAINDSNMRLKCKLALYSSSPWLYLHGVRT